MKKEYNSPKINVEQYEIIEEINALTISSNALNWETIVEDSIDWE